MLILAVWGLSACQARPALVTEPAQAAAAAGNTAPTRPAQAASQPQAAAPATPAPVTPVEEHSAPVIETEPPLDSRAAASEQAPGGYFPGRELVFGPASVDFDIRGYLKQSKGFLAGHQEYMDSTGWTAAADIVKRVALENSINPRLLLAVLEYQCGCVRGSSEQELAGGYALGVEDFRRKGLYGQLWWAANQLSAGYYGSKEGWLTEFTLPDGRVLPRKPDTQPGWFAMQYYFGRLWTEHDKSRVMGAQAWAELHPHAFGPAEYAQALDPQVGFLKLYREMYGEGSSLQAEQPPVPTVQPAFVLPFEPGHLWTLSSGPHQPWENQGSWAALDFAPASDYPGCTPTNAWATAVADGTVVRVGPGLVVLDLDGDQAGQSDGLEQTGWAVMYMHIAEQGKIPLGARVQAGDRIGQPSCEGGPATGTHLHIARKYDGEWIAAGGEVPFVMDGWTAHAGQQPYQGTLTRDGQVVNARPNGAFDTRIIRPEPSPTPPQRNPELVNP